MKTPNFNCFTLSQTATHTSEWLLSKGNYMNFPLPFEDVSSLFQAHTHVVNIIKYSFTEFLLFLLLMAAEQGRWNNQMLFIEIIVPVRWLLASQKAILYCWYLSEWMRTVGVVKFRSHNLTTIFGSRQTLLAVCRRLRITLKGLLLPYKGENKMIEFLSKILHLTRWIGQNEFVQK